MLDTLWARGSGTVRELVDGGCEDLAYTTVMTTLDRLFKKGLLARAGEGRAFRYTPECSREELQRCCDELFPGYRLDLPGGPRVALVWGAPGAAT